MEIVAKVLIALLSAVLTYLVAAFLLGLMGVGQPWPSLLGLLAGAAYFVTDARRNRV